MTSSNYSNLLGRLRTILPGGATANISGYLAHGGSKDAVLSAEHDLLAVNDPDTGPPRRKWPLARLSFLVFVILPSLATIFYLAFVASDQYVSEARFAVRSVSAEDDSSGKSVLGGSGSALTMLASANTSQNAHIVASYIRSPALVSDLLRTVDLRQIFFQPEFDPLSRLKAGASKDELTNYWLSMVKATIEGPSGIVTLEVAAFRREDALLLARETLRLSEMLVNEISARARRDATAAAEEDVLRSFAIVRKALGELQQYRNEAGIINPVEAATDTAKLMLQLMAEKIRLENDLFVGRRQLSESAPTIKTLNSRLQSVDAQIADLRAKISGDKKQVDNIAAKLSKFEELEVSRQFAEKRYEIAQASLDRARLHAERQNVYLTTFMQPSLPDEAKYPNRLSLSIIISMILLAIWSIAALVWASVEDHRL